MAFNKHLLTNIPKEFTFIYYEVNGARNILKRSFLEDLIKPHTPKKEVLQILVKRYLERLTGCNSAPWELLRAKIISVIPNPWCGGINVYKWGNYRGSTQYPKAVIEGTKNEVIFTKRFIVEFLKGFI